MKYQLRLRTEAEKDMSQAYNWYNDQQTGLGDVFLCSVETMLEKISEHPLRFPLIHKSVRRALISQFPYAIFFTLKGSTIEVLAVFHCKRNPIFQ